MPALKKNDLFVVAITDTLTDVKHKVLNFLYAPIMGTGAVQLYMTLISCVGFGAFESESFNHNKIFQMMDLKQPQEFLQMRESLEAMGLLDVYYNQGVYLYLLKEPLHPYEFFKNDQLVHLLNVKVGKAEFDRLVSEFLTYKYNITNFSKITKGFDEVYGIVPLNNQNTFENWWASATNNGVVLKSRHFDFNHLDILVRARDLLDDAILKSEPFYEEINNLSFMYGFSESDLAEIILLAIDQMHHLDYQKLRQQAKYYYDRKGQPVAVKKVAPKAVTDNNETIRKLEESSPNEIIMGLYNTPLTSGEVEMFDELRRKTGYGTGVINVLLVYLTREKNGEIPSFNYFLKVANAWKRAKVQTTEDAINYINKINEAKPTYGKKEKPLPEWYDAYLKDVQQKVQENKEKDDGESLESLMARYKESK